MGHVQLVAPNLDTVANIGWCLSFMEDVFSTPHMYATATDGWNATQFPHADAVPTDVAVPIWFSYYENGINYGHVALNVPGRGVLSSPYKQDGTHWWFSSIDECASVLNCGYLGWSEDLATVRVVIEKEVAVGVTIMGNPSICSWGPDRRDVFAQGTDGGLWHRWYDTSKRNANKGWSADWEKLPGGIGSSPDCVSATRGSIDIVGKGDGGTLYHWWLKPDGSWGLEDLGIIKA